MNEIAAGLHHWSAHHENIGQNVSSYYYEPARALLDPKEPAGGVDSIPGPSPELIVLTCRHHRRDCVPFVERFGCRVLCHEAGLHEYEGDEELKVEGYATGDRIAPGIEVLAMNAIAPDDAVLGIDVEGGALAFADAIINYDGIGFVPDYLIGDNPEDVKRETFDRLAPLLARPSDTLLFAHGQPVAGGGDAALEAFVASGREQGF